MSKMKVAGGFLVAFIAGLGWGTQNYIFVYLLFGAILISIPIAHFVFKKPL